MPEKENPLIALNNYMLSRGYNVTLKTSFLLSKSGEGNLVGVRFSPPAPFVSSTFQG